MDTTLERPTNPRPTASPSVAPASTQSPKPERPRSSVARILRVALPAMSRTLARTNYPPALRLTQAELERCALDGLIDA